MQDKRKSLVSQITIYLILSIAMFTLVLVLNIKDKKNLFNITVLQESNVRLENIIVALSKHLHAAKIDDDQTKVNLRFASVQNPSKKSDLRAGGEEGYQTVKDKSANEAGLLELVDMTDEVQAELKTRF